jgi:hypothetical protein
MVDLDVKNAGDSVVAAPVNTTAPPPVKAGIGGWLVLPVIIVLVQPIALVVETVKVVTAVVTPSSSFIYWPALCIDIILGALTIYIAVALFRKRPVTPMLFVLYSALAFVLWSTANSVLPPEMFVPKGMIMFGGGGDGARAMVVAFVWGSALVPYFLFSRRVSATFVHEPAAESGLSRSLVVLWQRLVRRRLLVSILWPVASVLYLFFTFVLAAFVR